MYTRERITHGVVVVQQRHESGLSNPDVVLVVVRGTCTDPVLGVVLNGVDRHGVPLDVDHTVAVQRVAAAVVRHVAEVEHCPVVLNNPDTVIASINNVYIG